MDTYPRPMTLERACSHCGHAGGYQDISAGLVETKCARCHARQAAMVQRVVSIVAANRRGEARKALRRMRAIG
jgi:hypothetical protein